MLTVPLSHWIIFHGFLVALLAIEFAFSRWRLPPAPRAVAGETPQPPSPERAARQHRNAIVATIMWVAAAGATAIYFFHTLGAPAATQFLAGYTIEEALSVDNLFLFLLLFRIFNIPEPYQPRVLFWGVAGAIVMRGAFIAAGLGLLERFHWVDYIFGLILLIAAVRLILPQQHESENDPPRKPVWIRWISRIHPVSLRTDIFYTTENGRGVVTMLFLALLAIEVTDVVFALDSIPAVLSITRQPFIAYTSNILAVMGLRSLFFLLARMLKQLRFLHFGLAAILFFAAAKMLLSHWLNVGAIASLAVIVGILAITITFSLALKSPQTAGSAEEHPSS